MCLVVGPIATRPVHLQFLKLSKSRHFSTCHVSQSLKNASTDPKAYSKTLLLPKTTFPLRVDPAKSESSFQSKTCEELYRWQAQNVHGPLFVLLDGPPYANGHLHMGHALNKIIKDIINRYQVLSGHQVHYHPGWDCHGLPIENKALQELKKDALSLPPNVIRAAAKATAEREMKTQQEEFEQFCIMADWSPQTTFRTLDHDYEIRQLRVFQQMVEQGLIYRHYRPVHYSPSSHSALAEAELVYNDEHVSHSVYVTFPLDSRTAFASTALREVLAKEPSTSSLVWTTTPWTLTANMGIAVHPELTYSIVRSSVKEDALIVAKDRLEKIWWADEAGKKMSKSLGNIVSPMTIIHGGKDKKKEPAYGADVLRLWVATVEYWRDTSIGATVLAQCAESMRRIRNSARFVLGNIGTTAEREHFVPVERSELGLAERFVMNELYKLDQTAAEGYTNYNFPKVMNSLTNFANITLSSLYFDITKDCLYADDIQSVERRAVVSTLAKVLDCMTSVMAPVLPYLAEEIHSTLHEGDETVSQLSVFTKKWTPVSAEWNDPHAEQDMTSLLRMRNVVLSLLEKARRDKNLKSSLEAEVDIILPNDISVQPYLLQLIEREEAFLKTLFIVSNANITDEGSLGTSSFAWSYVSSMDIPDSDLELAIRVRPASSSKCPRCWTYTREEEHDLCPRCEDVVRCAD
ncbi:tRNA synthetases class I-domain-containing protein [Suillus spraguei]|nr:tRNA synthetases class I-domain-containing protein [Suillus spraguei]